MPTTVFNTDEIRLEYLSKVIAERRRTADDFYQEMKTKYSQEIEIALRKAAEAQEALQNSDPDRVYDPLGMTGSAEITILPEEEERLAELYGCVEAAREEYKKAFNDLEDRARRQFREAAMKVVLKNPHREKELKALFLIWEVTNFSGAVSDDGMLPTKVPVFIGPTSTGKTELMKEVGKVLDGYMTSMLLQHENPDELAGYMVPVHKNQQEEGEGGPGEDGYHLRYAMPEWFRGLVESDSLFKVMNWDELDKPPREAHSAILTFLRNKTLRKWKAPFCTLLGGAMNPTDVPLDAAFIARCIFIKWGHNTEHYKQLFPKFSEIIGNFSQEYERINDAAGFPALPEQPDLATLHFLNAAKRHPWFWEEDVRNVIVRGMLQPPAAATVLNAFSRKITPPKDVLLKDPSLTRKIILAMNEEDVVLLYTREMYPMFTDADPVSTKVFGEFNYWMWEYGRWGDGTRAYEVQKSLAELPLEVHAMIAMHAETWRIEVKPILNGDGTKESFMKSLIWAVIVNLWDLENPDRKYHEYEEDKIVRFGEEVEEAYAGRK